MIEILEETGSTNADMLARLAANEHIPEGHWIIARRQNAGRGRQGRNWFDGAGNFMGSTLLRTHPQEPPAHSLALVSALATYEAILPSLPDPAALKLKWPNDLMLGGAKLAGILLEASGEHVVIGIGVNLRAAPDLLDRETVALADVTAPPTLEDFAERMAQSFDAELERWRTFGLEALLRRWQACAHPVGTPISVHDGSGAPLQGTFDGLDPHGSLQLRLGDGTSRIIHAGDIVIN